MNCMDHRDYFYGLCAGQVTYLDSKLLETSKVGITLDYVKKMWLRFKISVIAHIQQSDETVYG